MEAIALVFAHKMLLLKAHKIADNIETKIKIIDKKANWLISIHLDPYDDSDVNKVC